MDETEQEHAVRNLVLSVCDLKQHGDIPPARCGAQAVTIGTRMYLHGGADEKQCFGDMHLLEIEQMKWTELNTEGTQPAARFGHSLTAHHTELVLFGGLVSSGEAALLDEASRGPGAAPPFVQGMAWGHTGSPDNGLYTLQTESLSWQRLNLTGEPPSPRFYHSGCIANDLYVIFGGCADNAYSQPLNDLHTVDLRNMQWNSVASSGDVPTPRFAHKMIYVPAEDNLLLFGGNEKEGSAELGVLYAMKLSTSTWSRVEATSTPPLERSFHSFDLIGNRAFVFAGQTGTEMTDLYIYDTANGRWARPLYEGQLNVRAHASAVLHDKLIVFGGVRDKAATESKKRSDEKHRISKKLFFLNVLEIKDGVSEGDFKFKLVTIGDSGVGKSCLLTRFVSDWYSDFHVSTIGVDFKTVITMVKGRLVKLQLWDTAGQERFSVVTGNYYRNSDGFIFVYDATNRASFEHVDGWLGQVQQHHECGPTTMKILVGNKHDLKNEIVVTEAEAKAKAESMGAYFVSTSAKTAANVDMAFLMAAQNLVEMRRQATQQQPRSLQLTNSNARPTQGPASKKCCAGGGASLPGFGSSSTGTSSS